MLQVAKRRLTNQGCAKRRQETRPLLLEVVINVIDKLDIPGAEALTALQLSHFPALIYHGQLNRSFDQAIERGSGFTASPVFHIQV
jgi:hypothetical protein